MADDAAASLALAPIIEGLVRGVGAVVLLVIAIAVLHALEAWRFTPSRGAIGAIGHALRAWRRAWRDPEAGTGLLAALTAIVPTTTAAAAFVVVPHTPIGRTVIAALLLPAIMAPVLGALAGGSAARARLSLDDALMRSARRGVLLTAIVVVAGTGWLAPIGGLVLISLLRLHHPGASGFKPRADSAVGDGTRLALAAGERAAILIVAALVVDTVITLLSVSASAGPSGLVIGALTSSIVGVVFVFFVVVWFAVRVVEWLGPLSTQGLGSRGPLLLLAVAVVVRWLGGPG